MNRDLFTADGREWFEPAPHDLVQTIQETRTISHPKQCAICGQTLSPQMMRVNFERQRTWTQTGAISGVFSDWGPWRVVSFECLKHDEIPF